MTISKVYGSVTNHTQNRLTIMHPTIKSNNTHKICQPRCNGEKKKVVTNCDHLKSMGRSAIDFRSSIFGRFAYLTTTIFLVTDCPSELNL